jgi:hypothetical protein
MPIRSGEPAGTTFVVLSKKSISAIYGFGYKRNSTLACPSIQVGSQSAIFNS